MRDFVDHAGVGAAFGGCHPGARMSREPADMHLVDDGSLERMARRCIVLPIIGGGIDNDALECGGGIVSWLVSRLAAPCGWPRDAFAVGIEQHFAGVEAQAVCRVEQSLGTKCVELARREVLNEYMQLMEGAVGSRIEHDHARRPRVVHMIEQAEFDPVSMLGEHAEIDATIAE